MEFSKRYGLRDDLPGPSTTGPELKERKTTDKTCLAIFLILMTSTIIISANNLKSSQFRAILSPLDSDGVPCGQNLGPVNAEKFKFLYVDYPEKGQSALSKRVCVEECPTSSSKIINCLPNSAVASCQTLKVHDTKAVASRVCVPTDLSFYKNASQLIYGLDSSTVFDAVINNYRLMAISAVLAFVLALVYSKFLSKCAFVVILTTFGLAYATIGYFGLTVYNKSATLIEESNDSTDGSKMRKAAGTYKMGAYALWTLTAALIVIALLLLGRIRAAIGVLQNAGKFMVQNKSILLVPFLALITGTLATIAWALFALAFLSQNSITSSENSNFAQVNIKSQTWHFWIIIVSYFWLLSAIFSGVKFTVTTAVCLWHLEGECSSLSRTIKALYWTIRYHLGTVFFGSLVLLVAGVCKSVCQYIVARVPTSGSYTDMNWILSKCIVCIVSGAEKAIKYFTEQVYCQVALSSESFCISARSVSKMTTVGMMKFDAICEFLMFTGRLLISGAVVIVSKLVLDRQSTEASAFNTSGSKFVTLLIVFVISWTISSIFTLIWAASCDSIIVLQAMEKKSNSIKFDSKISKSVDTSMETIGNSLDYI